MEKKRPAGMVALKGLAWLLIYNLAGKGASLVAQVALGWFLPKEAYGVWAIILSVSTVTAMLRNGGTAKLLIQRGNEYEILAPSVMKFALIFNLLAMILLMAGGVTAAWFYHSPNLLWMIAILALEIPLGTPAAVFSSKLAIDHKFSTLSKIGILSSFLRQGLTVFLAYFGFGPASFVIPVVVEGIFNSFCFWRAVRKWPKPERMSWNQFSSLFSSSRWIMLGALVVGLSFQGDYLVISIFETKEQLGIYFFALQLVGSVAMIFTMSIETVMLPMFAPLSETPEKQRVAFSNAIAGVYLIGIPIAVIGYFLIEPLVQIIWHGSWDESIPIMKVVMLGMPGWLMVSLGRSLLEARGMWKARLLQMGFFGLGSMIAAGYGASTGDIVTIAIWVSAYRFIYGSLQITIIGRHIGIPSYTTFKLACRPIILTIAAVLLSKLLTHSNYFDVSASLRSLILAAIYLVIFVVLTILFLNKQWHVAINIVAKKNQHAY